MLAEPFFILHSFDLEILDLGEIAKIFAKNTENGDLLLLSGKVGVGKTEFARLLIKATAKNENIDIDNFVYTDKSEKSFRGEVFHSLMEDIVYDFQYEKALDVFFSSGKINKIDSS